MGRGRRPLDALVGGAVDGSGKDLPRLTFLAYDPQAAYNPTS